MLLQKGSGMLTQKQLQLLEFIYKRTQKNGISPSFDEMKEALDLRSKSGIHRLITALEERGFIRRLAHRARAIEVTKMPHRQWYQITLAQSYLKVLVHPVQLVQLILTVIM